MRTLLIMLLATMVTQAQLTVTVSPPKIVGQKAVVKLEMKNNFSEKVESARAACFLMDNRGKMFGQSSKWVIGGKKDRPALEAKKETSYSFVVPVNKPSAATNLTTKVSFSRLILEGGAVDVSKNVRIKNGK